MMTMMMLTSSINETEEVNRFVTWERRGVLAELILCRENFVVLCFLLDIWFMDSVNDDDDSFHRCDKAGHRSLTCKKGLTKNLLC